MKIKVGDIVKAGCNQGKAQVLGIIGGKVTVKYLTTPGKVYTYPLWDLDFVERPLKKGSTYVYKNGFTSSDVEVLAVNGIWAMVRGVGERDSEYPFIVKISALSKKFEVCSKQTAIEAIDKALRSQWHREKNEYLEMVRDYLSR